MNNSNLHIDFEVLADFRKGNEGAFEVIYEHFYQRVYFFALRFVQAPDAKDVTSEAFIKLWNKKEMFTSPESVSNFLFVSVRNRCFDIWNYHWKISFIPVLLDTDQAKVHMMQLSNARKTVSNILG